MASITGTGSFGRARWLLDAVLHWMHPAEQDIATTRTPVRPLPKKRRHYPPRNPMFEQALMAREMYRL